MQTNKAGGCSITASKWSPLNMPNVIFSKLAADFGIPSKSGSSCSNEDMAHEKETMAKRRPTPQRRTSAMTREQTKAKAEMRVEKTDKSTSRVK